MSNEDFCWPSARGAVLDPTSLLRELRGAGDGAGARCGANEKLKMQNEPMRYADSTRSFEILNCFPCTVQSITVGRINRGINCLPLEAPQQRGEVGSIVNCQLSQRGQQYTHVHLFHEPPCPTRSISLMQCPISRAEHCSSCAMRTTASSSMSADTH